MALTDDEWIEILLRLSAPDLLVFCDVAAGVAQYEQTGKTADLHTAWLALKARVEEKRQIAKT